ncbi:polymeric immunoglobulin receptor-like [Nematolebias whitei]|uniref:polymeric immunoglobulin receptor-like n=1 Tax=Nematolebias whitei TaxID=451745 RepID=UPI001899DF98|nr:polymeric immunoglobulin receptor-like [Nematolebias whitei]
MWTLHNLQFVLFSLIHVFGYEGRGARISCSYGQGYEDYEKYLCKDNCGDSDILILTSQTNGTKYFIFDEQTTRVFTTTIADLRFADAGKYWCGVSRSGKDIYTEVKLEIQPDSCCDNVTKVQGVEEGSVSIICPYESKYQNNLKYMCRGNQRSTCLQQALITSNTRHNGRVTLNDDKKSNTFTVTVLNLTLEDSGSYLCGVQRETGLDDFSAAELEIKEWCCVKSKNIKGTLGRPVTLQCSYPHEHRNNRKFICKGERRSSCEAVTMDQDRFTLHNISSSFFSVTITKLEAGDAGTYWCRSQPEWAVGDYTQFHLAVDKSSTVALCCLSGAAKLIRVSGREGRDVNVSCLYQQGYESYEKYLCKNDCSEDSHVLIRSTDVKKDRYFTHDDKEKHVFVVTISGLTSTDAGTYWCGLTRTGYDSYSAQVNLEVQKAWCCVKTTYTSSTVGHTITLSCPHPPQHRHNRKFLCKGDDRNSCIDVVTSGSRFTLQEDVSSSSFSVMITKLEEGDAGTYWCGSDSQWSVGNYTKIELSVDKRLRGAPLDKPKLHAKRFRDKYGL